jgi:cell division septation protein DedD
VSLFFVVVALCGVFFAMGYMVRGNALKTALPNPDDAASAQANTAGAGVKRQQPEPPRETVDSAAPDPVPQTTAPADDNTQSASPAASKPVQEGASAPPIAVPPPKPFSDSSAATAKPSAADAEGTWVQVAALGRADADATMRTLREQHLPATVVPSPKEGLFRVRVGPYHQTSDVADAKARLKTLGFSNTIVQKQ